MRKVVLTYGLLSGGLITVFLWLMMALWEKEILNFDNGDVAGYAGMIIALSMIFFGIKSYRDRYAGGSIKFLKGAQIGLLISLIAALMYAAGWELYYQTNAHIQNNFMDQYAEYCINKLKKDGASTEEVNKAAKDMEEMKAMYKNPAIRFGMTLMEIFPVGILVTLICAGILRKKEVLPG